MCGIAGFFSPRAAQPAALLDPMLAAVRHRGPDGEGRLLLSRRGDTLVPGRSTQVEAALGHARLAIVDLSADGAEPMPNEDKSLWLTFNGEVYNQGVLRGELERAGHRFRSQCDAEVVLHGYEEEGPRFFRRLEGMFALALLDLAQEALLLVRDPFGIKPLFHAPLGKGRAFASELSGLLPALSAPTLDPAGVGLFLGLGYVPAPHTVLKDVDKLPPGVCLRVDAAGTQVVDVQGPPLPPLHRRDGRAFLPDTREVLRQSVAAHLMADVEVGVFLSGGIDSTAVALAVQDVSVTPVQAFTMAVEDPDLDESPQAARAARALGLRHHVRRVQPADALARLPALLGELDEPLADASLLPTRLCAELAREHVKVVLSGDGGDELFGGYTRHRVHQLGHWARLGGKPLAWAARLLTSHVPGSAVDDLYRRATPVLHLPPVKTPARKVLAAAQGLQEPPALAYARLFRTGLDEELRTLGLPVEPLHAHVVEAGKGFLSADPLGLAQAVDLRSHLPGDILTKVDRASMAVGLEARVPLISSSVARHAASLPGSALLHGGVGKRVLRDLVEQRLGPDVAQRPKRGFGLPLAAWLEGPLRAWRQDALGSLGSRGVVQSAGLTELVRGHDAGVDRTPLLFALCVLEMWLRTHGVRVA